MISLQRMAYVNFMSTIPKKHYLKRTFILEFMRYIKFRSYKLSNTKYTDFFRTNAQKIYKQFVVKNTANFDFVHV